MPRGDNNRRLTPEQIDEIVQRYETQLPDGTWEGTTTLARDYGVRPATIQRWLLLRGVTIRDAKESHSGGKRCKPIKNLPQGEAPPCACGCGSVTAWNGDKNRWNIYIEGHRYADAPYKDEGWLREQYVTLGRGIAEIAAECGVSTPSIVNYVEKFRIPRQPIDHSRKGRPGARNAAWKGGVAQWPYSPDWRSLARTIRDRDKWTCQDCGEQRKHWGVHLHVHHIDGNKLNNDPANLISLCAKCHRRRHVASNLGGLETEPAA